MKWIERWFPKPRQLVYSPEHIITDFNKIILTLETCNCELVHVKVVERMVDQFGKKWMAFVSENLGRQLLKYLYTKVDDKRQIIYSELNGN